MQEIHLHHHHSPMAAATAVQSLIALSDTICPPLIQPTSVGSGNFFGPWITDESWSPRKPFHTSPTITRKKSNSQSGGVSKSLPRRLSLYTSANINNSPYGLQRSHSPAPESSNSSITPRSRLGAKTKSAFGSFDAGRQSKARSRGSKAASRSNKVTKSEDQEDDELGEEEQEEVLHKNKHSHFHKPSLPALITLTANTNDTRSTFALGRQLELPLPRVYVSVGPNHSARALPTTNRSCSAVPQATMTIPSQFGPHHHLYGHQNSYSYSNDKRENNSMENFFSYKSNDVGRDSTQSRAEALKRALAARNPPPPTHNYEDISEHMRYYRIHHTVLGTGRFSLANERDQQGQVKPVQWQDLFPNRPLTAANSVTDVPIFRFSVADFRSQTAPSSKGARSSSSPLPRALTPKYLSADDDLERIEIPKVTVVDQTDARNREECSDTSTATDEHDSITAAGKDDQPASVTDNKSGSSQLEERYAKASRASSFTVYNDSIQQAKKLPSDPQGEDNEYMQYLRAKNSLVRRPTFQPNNVTDVKGTKVKTGTSADKHDIQNSESKEKVEADMIISDDEGEQEEQEEQCVNLRKTRKAFKQQKIIKGSNFAAKKCEGQYGPSTQAYHRHVCTSMASRGGYFSFEKHHQFTRKLVVDADRLRESVDEKIDEGERQLRSSINKAAFERIMTGRGNKKLWQKIRKIEQNFDKITGQGTKRLGQEAGMSVGAANEEDNDSMPMSYITRSQIKDQKSVDGNTIDFQGESSMLAVKENKSPRKDKSVASPCSTSLGLVTSYDFRGYVEALRSMHDEDTAESCQNDTLNTESMESLPGRSDPFIMNDKKKWRPKDSRVRSAARGGRYRRRFHRKVEAKPKSQVLAEGKETDSFPRTTASATLRYKPTSPATSAFVIAAPPSSTTTGAGGRSVVLPLEDFMEMAVEGKDQSFAEWKTCLNNSSFGPLSRSQAGGSQRSRGDGLLKVVSFATPVNQFIFAKKITFDSTENLGVFPSDISKKKRKEEPNNGGMDQNTLVSGKYRLKLSDFGLPEKFKKQSQKGHNTEQRDEKSKILQEANKSEKLSQMDKGDKRSQQTQASNQSSTVAPDSESICDETNVKDTSQDQQDDLQHDLAQTSVSESFSKLDSSGLPSNSKGYSSGYEKILEGKEKPKRARSMSAEAHACLRKEILRLMEGRKSEKVSEEIYSESAESKVEGRKNWSISSEVKGMPVLQLLHERGKGVSSTQSSSKPPTAGTVAVSDHRAVGSFTFRLSRQSSSSLSPRRLTLKHAARRASEHGGSLLSPSGVHKYFQRRFSNNEDGTNDLDIGLSPLEIKGGSLSRQVSFSENDGKQGSLPGVAQLVGQEMSNRCENSNEGADGTALQAEDSVPGLDPHCRSEHNAETLNHKDEALTSSSIAKTEVQHKPGDKKTDVKVDVESVGDQKKAVNIESSAVEKSPATPTCLKKAKKPNDNIFLRKTHNVAKKTEKYVRFSVDF